MHTLINYSDTIPQKASLVLLAGDVTRLGKDFLSEEEVAHILHFHKEHKKNLFVFNYLDHWKFIRIAEKERNAALALENCRMAGHELVQQVNASKVNEVFLVNLTGKPDMIFALAEGMALANYQFLRYKKKKEKEINPLNEIIVYDKKPDQTRYDRLNILLDATCRCRDMVNEPVSWLTAEKMAEQIAKMAGDAGVKVEVFGKSRIEALKMGGLLAVNRGSQDPPTFTILEWKPVKPVNKKPVVLIGKGIVFDSGGMNLKTGEFMNHMKCDMAGGAAVASAIYAAARSGLNVWVAGLVPATDNRTGPDAYVTGDVITMFDGTHVEVLNTDAEGRLILADALGYAKKYNPSLVITMATLTGSAARAIGKYGIVAMHAGATGEFRKLREAGDRVHERLVEFPFWKDYDELIKSDIAEIKNLGGTDGGAITAGKFLAHFARYPFIHLDIAGPAWVDHKDGYRGSGGTGIGVRLLFEFLKNMSGIR